MSALGTVGQIRLFRELAREDRERVARVSRVVSFERGERLFREGDRCSSLVAILCGRVKVLKTTRQGRDLILGLFGRGDPVGAVAVFQGVRYPATAIALESTKCLEIPKKELLALLESRPSMALGLLAALSRRLVYLADRLAHEHSRVEVRYARFFLKLAESLTRTQDSKPFIPISLSRQDLADIMGTTIETSIRLMSRWGQEGIVETLKDGFVIKDMAALIQHSHGDGATRE